MNKPKILSHIGADLTKRLEQAITVLIGLFVFLNPFPHATAPQEIVFYGSLAMALYLFASGKKTFAWPSPLTIPFLLLIIWSAAGIVFALDRVNSLNDVLFHLVKYVIFFFLLINFYPSPRHLQSLSWIVILSTTTFVIAALVHFYVILGHSFAVRLGYSGQHGFFEMSANYMGFTAVFAALLSLNQFVKEGHGARKALLALCFFATVTATLLTQTRGAVIALFLAIILFGMKNHRGLLLAVLLPVLIAAVIFTTAGSRERFSMKGMQSNERIGIGLMYWEIIKDYPVKGIGFGMEMLQKKEFVTPYYDRVPEASRDPGFHVSPHNFYVDVTVRLGVVGLLLYVYIIITALRMARRDLVNATNTTTRSDALCLAASFGAVLVQAFFADASFGAPAIVFYLHLAMITILWRETRKPALQASCEQASGMHA